MAPAKIMVPVPYTAPGFLIFQTFEDFSPLSESQRLIYLIVYIIMYMIHSIKIINISKDLIITTNNKFLQDEYHTADE